MLLQFRSRGNKEPKKQNISKLKTLPLKTKLVQTGFTHFIAQEKIYNL